MGNTVAPREQRTEDAASSGSTRVESRIEALVAAEVQKQFDRERSLFRDSANIALKIIGGAFALLVAIFTIFGLTTWKDIAKETTEYMKTKVDELVQKSDSETGVKQTLNDLVNRAIIDSELTSLKRNADKELGLPKFEWDRIRAWLKLESLGNQEFSDALAVLNAQADERKKADANSFLSEMLNPTDTSPYSWIRKQPGKRIAIMSNFLHADMGSSAIELARSVAMSEEMRIAAIQYIREIRYVDGFDKLFTLIPNMEDGKLKTETFITCAVTRPSNPRFIAEVTKLTAQPTTNSLEIAAKIIQELLKPSKSFQSESEKSAGVDLEKQLLKFAFDNGGYISFDSDRISQMRLRSSSLGTADRALLWIPTDIRSATGFFLGLVDQLEKFNAYFALLADAANSGDDKAIRATLPLLRRTDNNAAVPYLRIGLGSTSEIVVNVANSKEQRILRQPDLREIRLIIHGGKSDPIGITWIQNDQKHLDGTILKFSGGGFNFSIEQPSRNAQ
jgi:hypothetical protein